MVENIRKQIWFTRVQHVREGNSVAVQELDELLATFNTSPAVQSGALPERSSLSDILLSGDEESPFTESELLTVQAKFELDAFFGFDVEVPEPPDELLETLAKFRKGNVKGFGAHYLPDHTFREDEDLPGWRDKPNPRYWKMVKLGYDIPAVTAGWYLIDTYSGYDYVSEPEFRDRQDYFDDAIINLRRTGEVQMLNRGTENSRYGISVPLIERVLLPGFADRFGITQEVRLPTGMEFNVIGNMAYPEWGRKQSNEYFSTKGQLGFYFLGGLDTNSDIEIPEARYNTSGLSDIAWFFIPDNRERNGGFRPLIVFPTTPQVDSE